MQSAHKFTLKINIINNDASAIFFCRRYSIFVMRRDVISPSLSFRTERSKVRNLKGTLRVSRRFLVDARNDRQLTLRRGRVESSRRSAKQPLQQFRHALVLFLASHGDAQSGAA